MGKKKVVSIEDRIPTLKQERKKKANRRLIFYLSIFFFLISIIVYLQSPLSHVKTIDISGNSLVKNEEVLETSDIRNGMNIWTINKSDVTQALQENPVIQRAEVDRKLPWTIDINITEADLVGYVKQEAKHYPVLGTGNVLQEREQQYASGQAPLLLKFSDEAYLQQMAQELADLPASIVQLISEIHWQPSDDNQHKILLYMNDGYIVDSTIRRFAENMRVYPSIVSQLDPESEGVIHIGAGVYFEAFNSGAAESPDDEQKTGDADAQ
ncbi:cell division protein FtsQ/DivIB [Lentibacillus salinarum]|uniref:Cell division protein DivIB n=1 Tax=Lentibacillus salinarum TaxID=446820 RepID=A0ABW3ZQB6_9BACI